MHTYQAKEGKTANLLNWISKGFQQVNFKTWKAVEKVLDKD